MKLTVDHDEGTGLLPIGLILAQQRVDAGEEVIVWRHKTANRVGRLISTEEMLIKGRPGVQLGVYTPMTTMDRGLAASEYKRFTLSELDDDCLLEPRGDKKWILYLCPPEGS